jgi:hypothetical protein
MASNPRLLELLEEMLESGRTPEEVCRNCPELLPEVRQRWKEFYRIDAQFRMLLPGLTTGPDAGTTAPPAAGLPQVPGYEVEAVLGYGGIRAPVSAHWKRSPSATSTSSAFNLSAFVDGVEPTNVAAERALRHGVLWRKMSHGPKSVLGSANLGCIWSVVETCRQQGRGVWDFLTVCLAAAADGRIMPSLLTLPSDVHAA